MKKHYGISNSYVDFDPNRDYIIVHNTAGKTGPVQIKIKDIEEVIFQRPFLGAGTLSFQALREGEIFVAGFGSITNPTTVNVRTAFGTGREKKNEFEQLRTRLLQAAKKARSGKKKKI